MNRDHRPSLDALANTAVLVFLATRAGGREETVAIRWPDEIAQPDLSLGCHPDVVERIWQSLNGMLPTDCRAVVLHTPVLLHPDSGIIFAFGLGTSYAIWVPPLLIEAATELGLKPTHAFTYDRQVDLRPLGDGWLFGGWLQEEATLCMAALETIARFSV